MNRNFLFWKFREKKIFFAYPAILIKIFFDFNDSKNPFLLWLFFNFYLIFTVVCGHLGPPSPRFGKNENAVTWDFRSQVRKVPGDRNFKKVEPGTVFQMTENDFFAKTRADTISLMLPLFFMKASEKQLILFWSLQQAE